MSQEAEWFLERNGKQEGPFTAAQIVSLHQKGELKKSDRVTAEWLFGEWIELEELVAGYQASRLDLPVSEPVLDIGGPAAPAKAAPAAPAQPVQAAPVAPTPAPAAPTVTTAKRATPVAPTFVNSPATNSTTAKQVIDPAVPLFELLQQAKERRAKRSTLFDVTPPEPEAPRTPLWPKLKPWIGLALFLFGAAYAVSFFKNHDFSSAPEAPPPPLPVEEEASAPASQTYQSIQKSMPSRPQAPAYIPPPRPTIPSGNREDEARMDEARREQEERDLRDLHMTTEAEQPTAGPTSSVDEPATPEAHTEFNAPIPGEPMDNGIPPPSLDGAGAGIPPAENAPYTQ